jgi:hypothetical protein
METRTPYRNGNGMPNMHAELMATSGIELHYRTGAEVLLAAIMREPHVFQTVASRISPAWWKQTKYEHVARQVFEQFYSQNKTYSPYTVCKPGSDVTEAELWQAMNKHCDTDLLPALEMFEPLYRQWVELKASQFAAHGIAQGWDAEQIRSKQDEFRRDSCAYLTDAAGKDEWFENWFEGKMKGQELAYPCKPALKTLINNRLLIGYEPGTLYLIGAEPGTGKTFFFLQDMLRFISDGSRGIFVSLDMNARMIKIRIIGMITGVTHDDDWTTLSEEKRAEVVRAKEFTETMPVVILDKTNNIDEIIATCYAEHYERPINFLAIDFIQKVVETKSENRNHAIGNITGKLKLIANRLNIPVIALSQLSRPAVQGQRPDLSRLRDSGNLEADADVVAFLHRPEKYGVIEDPKTGQSLIGKGEIIFAKQRMRKTDSVWCGFDGVKGWHDLEQPTGHKFPETEYPPKQTVDYSVPASARPSLGDEDVPF